MFVFDSLKVLAGEGREIRIGLIGAGFMGRGIVEVVETVPAMSVVAISDVELERAENCFREIGVSDYRHIRHSGELARVRFPEERVVCSDYRLIPALEGIDVVIEATGVPEIGASAAYESIRNGKHVGMLNVEADVTVGYYLQRLAKKYGVVYTVCTGDEPAALKELYDFALTCGFTVTACGKGKNNPLDVSATPDSLAGRAERMGLSPKILTEFVDGSKTMVEMSCLANGTGLTIDKRNMHGPHADVDELARVFTTRENGGILGRRGVVDYVIGNLAPGVFMVVRHEGRLANRTLEYLRIGSGPDFVLYRPYHLTSVEVPVSIALAFLYRKACLATENPPTTEVITIAKRDLKRGDHLDRIGGWTVYGGIETASRAKEENLLPLGLAEGARLNVDVPAGSAVSLHQVELRPGVLLELRRIQDTLDD
jgi:predicted homoserine dehydrogenase-like protein